jgi:putative sigma-54 modulation protein
VLVRIQITGRHVGVTEAMKAYARGKVEKLGRLHDRLTHIDVVMDVVHGAHVVEVEASANRQTHLVAKVESPDMYAAVDLAEAKLLAQLRKSKEKLTDRHRGQSGEFLRSADGAPPPAPAAPGEETYEDVIDRMKEE